MKKATDRQERYLQFIKEFSRTSGYAPSVREIAQALGLASTSGVKSMIDRLVKKGFLRKESGTARTLAVEESAGRYAEEEGVPVLGRIRAGTPVMAEENVEGYIPLHDFLKASSGGFFLVVEGYSMVDRGIMPGDYAFIQPQKSISNGQIGAFRLNGEVTLKILKKAGDDMFLVPANEEFKPIPVKPEDDFEVIGRFVMLLRLVEKGYDRRLL